MTTHADIDALIATLHPHVFMWLFNYKLFPPRALRPRQDTADLRNVVQAFAELFSFHPGCDAAAATVQTSQSGNLSLYICLSPSIPNGFDRNVEEWLAQFAALRKESKSTTGGGQHGDTFSQSEKRFILYTYSLCYPAMRQRAISRGFGDWEVFVDKREHETYEYDLKPTKEEERLRQEYADELRSFSELVRRFADCVYRESLGDDEGVLRFHTLCMTIRDAMANRGFSDFVDEYIYCGRVGVEPPLAFFSPPLALSTLLALSRSPKLTLDDQWSFSVLDPFKGARQFSAAVTSTNLAERFGAERGIKQWENVVQAFEKSAARPNAYDIMMGYEWNADKNILSTAGPVAVHPEVTLIQHLVENREGKGEAYIACSRTPCYASAVYAVAVNETLKTRFTMHVDSPEWCCLYKAEPWILPENTQPDVMERLKEYLLWDLDKLMRLWVQERVQETLLNGHIASRDEDLG